MDEAKDNTDHNSVPKKGSNLNGKLKRNPNKNNDSTRIHVELDPQEGENVAETIRTEDDVKSGDINELVREPTETIGCQE